MTIIKTKTFSIFNKRKLKSKCLISLLFLIFLLLPLVNFAQSENIVRFSTIIKNSENDSIKANGYDSLAIAYLNISPDSAISIAEKGAEYFQKVSYNRGYSNLSLFLAEMEINAGKYELAQKRLIEIIKRNDEKNNKKIFAKANVCLGVIAAVKGENKKATQLFFNSLKTFEEIKDTQSVVSVYTKLGVINDRFNNREKALEYFLAAKKMDSAYHLSEHSLILLNNIGILYCKMNRGNEGLVYFNEALAKSTRPEYYKTRISVLNNLAKYFGDSGKKATAIVYLSDALSICEKFAVPREKIIVLEGLANYQPKNKEAISIAYLNEALEISKKIGLYDLEIQMYEDLIEIYKKQHKYEKALELTDLKQKIQDSTQEKNKAMEITNLQATYELAKSNEKVNELVFLIKKNNTKRNYIILIAGCTLILLIILGMSYFKMIGLNKQLTKQTEELSKANIIKDKLFSIIGHDLRGPIGNIPTMLELYEDETTSEEDRLYFKKNIIELAWGSKETLDKLLVWGKANMKGITLKKQTFKTKENIENCIKLQNSAAIQKNINIVDNTPPDTTINADVEHFDFVMRNLLANAVKFTNPGGQIEINANNEIIKGFTVFSVKDNGQGIDETDKPFVFEAINKGKLGTANEVGTNLGLMLCKDFITMNGGKIWVESKKGYGATFFFSLQNG